MLHSLKDLVEYTTRATDGDAGKVRGFYFDDSTWELHYLVLDTGGLLNHRTVLVSPAVLHEPDRKAGQLPIDLSVDTVFESPRIADDAPLARSAESDLNASYGWRVRANTPDRDEFGEEFEYEEGDLRSTVEVIGAYVEARDGSVGHIEDFIVDDESWTIRFVVIDTEGWWAGKHVLAPVDLIESLGWDDDKRVYMEASKGQLEESPEFDHDALSQPGSPFFHVNREENGSENRPFY